jgi:hypothetical protein
MIIRVYRLLLLPASAVTVQFWDDTNAALTGVMSLAQSAQLYLPFDTKPHLVTSKGNALALTLGTGVQCSGFLNYMVENA